nr:TerB N-terminal domain-containing protein [Halomonas socia]
MPNANVTAQSCWVPAGTSKAVRGITITRGRVFVGSGLAAGNEYGVEPSLVNPDLTVDFPSADRQGLELGYWPQYHRIGPQARAGYLQFLASDRDDPRAPMGFVFLYFYGMERRLLVDAQYPGIDEAEYQDLVAEIERLLIVYDHSSSFRGYANGLLDYLWVKRASPDKPGAAPTLRDRRHHLPVSLQVDLGMFSTTQRPIPAEWAYAWIMQDPQFQFRQRKASERCIEEFRELFKALYLQRHGEGLVVKPNKTMIKAEYKPASPGLPYFSEPLDLPNITILKGPTDKLAALVDSCCEQLAAYSRFIGRHPDRKDSLEALSLLPAALAAETKSADVATLEDALRQRLDSHAFFRVPFSELVLGEAAASASKPSAKSMRGLAGLLEHSGIGIEPDARYTAAVPDLEGDCILFAVQGESELPPSDDFEHAAVVMRLAGFVLYGQVDSLTDRHTAVIDDFLGGFSSLTSLETQHLKAYFYWEMGRKSTLAGMRKRVDGMSHKDRAELEQVLVKLASADGVVDTHELKKLRRTASLLGRDPEALYSQIHSVMAEPTLVRPASANATGFRIPDPAVEPAPASSKRKPLDAAAIQHKRQETEHISDVLHGIFGEQASPGEADRPAAPHGEELQEMLDGASGAPAEDDSATAGRLGGLDAAHLSLLAAIAQQADGLPRGEAEAMAVELKLMLAGALDRINEAAFEMTDAPVIEEAGGALVVDNEILEEMRG